MQYGSYGGKVKPYFSIALHHAKAKPTIRERPRAQFSQVGAHDGDWEHITVRLSPETGALQVYPSSRTISIQTYPEPHCTFQESTGMLMAPTPAYMIAIVLTS